MRETARVPGTTPDSPIPRRPFSGRRRIVNAAAVRIGAAARPALFDAGELLVRPGDRLVVDAERGPVVSAVVGLVERRVMTSSEVRRVIRRANADDLHPWEACGEQRDRGMRAAVKLLRKHRLDAKLVNAEFALGGDRGVFFFSSEERVDLRRMSRDLAAAIGARVDVRQIGVRDGAGVIGGIGPCGNELCCSSFLRKFSSVSIRFAKDQGLSLNPQRITGMCGRLKCCLAYEHPIYKEMKRYVPRPKIGVATPKGRGNVTEVDILARKGRVVLQGYAIEDFHLRDVIVHDRRWTPREIEEGGPSKEQAILEERLRRRGRSDTGGKMSRQAASVLSEEYIWDDTDGSFEVTGDSAAGADSGVRATSHDGCGIRSAWSPELSSQSLTALLSTVKSRSRGAFVWTSLKYLAQSARPFLTS